MRPVLAAVFVFLLLAWDITKNHGYYTHIISASLEDTARLVRW